MKTATIVLLILAASCENNSPVPPARDPGYSITVHLPIESSNYAGDTSFILLDSNGKFCKPELDTLTKGGGTIEYNKLKAGYYEWVYHSIFEEDLRKTFWLGRDTTFSFDNEAYRPTNAIDLDQIQAADSVAIVVVKDLDSLSKFSQMLKFIKAGKQYKLIASRMERAINPVPAAIDSGIFVDAFAEFEATLIGYREVGFEDNSLDRWQSNSVYLKCDKHMVRFDRLKKSRIAKAFVTFKESLKGD